MASCSHAVLDLLLGWGPGAGVQSQLPHGECIHEAYEEVCVVKKKKKNGPFDDRQQTADSHCQQLSKELRPSSKGEPVWK